MRWSSSCDFNEPIQKQQQTFMMDILAKIGKKRYRFHIFENKTKNISKIKYISRISNYDENAGFFATFCPGCNDKLFFSKVIHRNISFESGKSSSHKSFAIWKKKKKTKNIITKFKAAKRPIVYGLFQIEMLLQAKRVL